MMARLISSGSAKGDRHRVVMEIVELADPGEAGLQHLGIGHGGDRAKMIGGQPRDEAVHRLAPGPETVVTAEIDLGQPGHAALEGVAVEVGQARQDDAVRSYRAPARRLSIARHQPVADDDRDIRRPAVGQQGLGRNENAARRSSIASPIMSIHYWTVVQ
jgi:hypothetical protein